MKKIVLLFIVAGISSLVSCGPSEDEKIKQEEENKAAVDEMFEQLENSVDTLKQGTGPAVDTAATDTATQ